MLSAAGSQQKKIIVKAVSWNLKVVSREPIAESQQITIKTTNFVSEKSTFAHFLYGKR